MRRLPLSYLTLIAVSVILFGSVIHLSSIFYNYSQIFEAKNLASDTPTVVTVTKVDDSVVITSRNGSIPSVSQLSLQSQSLTPDPKREAGIIAASTAAATTAATAAAVTADLEKEVEIATTATAITTARAGDVFVPGSLNMTRFEAHQRCYVDEVLYKHHRSTPAHRYVSEKHKLIYFQITKGGSSTIRKKLDDSFGILKYICGKMKQSDASRFDKNIFHKFTFSREPTSRFVSSFFESIHRWLTPEKKTSYSPPTKELKDFVRVYNKTYLDEDDGHVVDAFETFVTNHYDGYKVPDTHLTLQIAQILKTEYCLHLDVIHDLEDLDDVFHELFTGHGLVEKKRKGQKSHMRRSQFYLNMSMVSVEVKQKVCQLSALDYCCLNYRLPPECEGVLSCRWRETKRSPWALKLLKSNDSSASVNTNTSTITNTSTSIKDDPILVIEAVSPYPLLPTQWQKG